MDAFLIANSVFAAAALVVSIVALIRSWKSSSLQDRVNKLEEELKSKDLEERRRLEDEKKQVKMTASIISLGNKRKIRIANTGGGIAYNVHYELEEGQQWANLFQHDHEPYEILEPMSSYDELVVAIDCAPPKVFINIFWEDESGESHVVKKLLSR